MSYADAAFPWFERNITAIPMCGKKSRIKWGHFRDKLITHEELTELTRRYPSAGTGIVLPDSLCCVDIDPAGLAELEKLEIAEGTPCEKTPRGGFHFWFSTTQVLPYNTKLAPGVELLGKGHLVRTAPTPGYETLIALNGSPPPLPVSIRQLLALKKVSSRFASAKPAKNDYIPDGERDDTLFQRACAMRSQGLEEREILGRIKKINCESCAPPLGENQLEKIAKQAAKYPVSFTDACNANVMNELFGEQLRYVHRLDGWRAWDETRWVDDIRHEADEFALKTIRERLRRAADLDDHFRNPAVKACLAAMSDQRRKALLSTAAMTVPEFKTLPTDYDCNPGLLNVLNGVVDLQTGKLLPHDRALMMSKIAAAPYLPEVRSELWERVVSEIFSHDEEMIGLIQRLAGYSATGHVHEHKFFFGYGGGSNGKDIVMNTIRSALGEYGYPGSFSTFTSERGKLGGPREDLCSLLGVRMFTAAETSGGAVFDEAAIKATTSNNPITTEHKYGREFTFMPTHTTWLAANVMSKVKDPTLGFWRRILLVPFLEDFTDRADKQLQDKLLQTELPGVLSWIVRGAIAWANDGLQPPAKVLVATEKYRDQEDLVGRFIAEEIVRVPVPVPGPQIGATALFRDFLLWCENQGERYSGRQADFGEAMARHGLPSVRATSGKHRGRYVYEGIRGRI